MLLADVLVHQQTAVVPWWSTFGIAEIAIAIVVIAAICGIVYVALNQFGVAIPPWVARIFWIVVCCFVVIAAIRLVASM